MPTYAIIGGTGSTGGAIIDHLLSRKDVKLHISVRSKKRLLDGNPQIGDASNAEVFEGDMTDIPTLTECLRGTTVVFAAAAQNRNDPACSVAIDTAQGIMSALETLRDEPANTFKPPTVVFLGSASLSPKLSSSIPKPMKWLLWQAIYYVYTDLARAIQYMEKHDWIPLLKFFPGGLTPGTGVGWHLSSEPPEKEELLSYVDLAGAMIEAAEDDKWVGREVTAHSAGVVPDAQPARLLVFVLEGLLASWLPWLWRVLIWIGIF